MDKGSRRDRKQWVETRMLEVKNSKSCACFGSTYTKIRIRSLGNDEDDED